MQTIGRYQLIDTLGQGGMGIVYRAFDTLLERTVALKVIGAQIDSTPETRARFFREARAAGQLSHKNIVTIYDLGEHDGHPFLAMEYLEGEDLQQRLSGGVKMSLPRKLDLAVDICEGLEYAHAHGVVHRDVKPANVFITTSGQVKILDFGLARLMTSQLTNSHMLMGTLNYMAPEQVRGDRADHRSDVFSVGVLLYELLGHKKAFEGDSFASTLYKILQEVPEPLWQVDATVPRALASIVEHALAKPLDERYQTMTALRQDLLLYRDQIRMTDSGASPAPGRPDSSPGAVTMLSPASSAAGSGAVSHGAAPAAPVTPAPSSTPIAGGSSWQMMAGALALVLAGIAGVWFATHRGSAPAAVPQRTEQPASPRIDTSGALDRAQRAMQAHDYAAAEEQARRVLQQTPGDSTALAVLDRARTAAAAVEDRMGKARAALAAGDFQAASRFAGDVLTLAPENAEAKQIMAEGATRSGGRSAADARLRMIDARAQARAARAPALAGPAYRTAVRAEQGAQRLMDSGRTADATARFYEASGLYQSAASIAQAQAAEPEAPPAAPRLPQQPGAEPARSADQASPPPDVAPKPAGPDPQPSIPSAAVAPPPLPPPAPSPAAPSSGAPSSAAPSPAAPREEFSPRPASPDDGINRLLAQYKTALESKDFDALKKIWPGLTGAAATAIQNEFQHASRITVDVVEPRISASGASGTVTFRRRYELQTRDGQHLRTETQTTMVVHRTPAGWVIESVQFSRAR